MKRQELFFILLVIFLVSSSGSPLLQAKEESSSRGTLSKVGKTIPKVILSRIDGQFFSSAELKGKVVIFDFWVTWYPPCRSSLPTFIELYQIYQDKNFEIIGLSLDKDIVSLKKFVEEMKINYPIVLSTAQTEQAFGGIKALPTTFLVDRRGKIRFCFVGYTPREVLEEKIKILIQE